MAEILLINRDPDILDFTKKILTNRNHSVVVASDIHNALETLKAGHISLVLCDANALDLNGLHFVKNIRAHQKTKHIHIAMLTARRNREDIQHAIQLGVSDYIVKPIEPSKLLQRIEKLLKTKYLPPEDLKTHNKDENPEFIETEVASEFVNALLVNGIGKEGVRVTSSAPKEVGATVLLRCPLFKDIGIRAKYFCVETCFNAQNDFVMDLKFINLSEMDEKILDNWIKSQKAIGA